VSKILVIGSFMMDLVARTPRAPQEGETIKGYSFGQLPEEKAQTRQFLLQGSAEEMSQCWVKSVRIALGLPR
jgi:hypothetical protein